MGIIAQFYFVVFSKYFLIKKWFWKNCLVDFCKLPQDIWIESGGWPSEEYIKISTKMHTVEKCILKES